VPTSDLVVSAAERAFLAGARRAVLGTIARDGRPRLVPICFVVDPTRPVLYTPLDDKPKSIADPARLARVRDVLADPRVTLVADRWDEDWARLAWVRCHGSASILEPAAGAEEHADAVGALRAKYRQYTTHRLETRPIVRIVIERTTSWGALALP